MANPFLAEIRIFAGNFAPQGWALCQGQLIAISQNTALFSLIGTFYGGNGTSNFALPNLQGSAPLHQGQGPGLSPRSIGEVGGETAVTLLATEMASHNHAVTAQAGSGTQATPAGGFFAEARSGRALLKPYSTDAANTAMAATAIGSVGGNQPHNNLQPYQVLTFIIALQGVFPARN